jgi:hypothetical protein
MLKKINDDDDFYPIENEGGDVHGVSEGYKRIRTKEERYKDDIDNFCADSFDKERGCTDKLFLIIFLAFLGSMIFLTKMGLDKGNIQKLLAPLDGDLNFCGKPKTAEDE